MKFIFLFLLSTITLTPLHSMQEQRQRQTCCSKLSLLASKTASFCAIVAYKATSWCGRNDYLYLAHAHSLWYLQMKLQHKEQIEDINRYYLRYGATFNTIDGHGTNAFIYFSPLHEAVQQGDLRAVMLLCNAGADTTLTIKSHIENSEAAKNCYAGCVFIDADNLTEDEVQRKTEAWNKSHYVGLSPLELAKKLDKEWDKDPYSGCWKKIADFLQNNETDQQEPTEKSELKLS